mmetsp:Transcript_4545/g.8849  ORF Transcript_4545/g.8849 Transcript_4545/m.8849 type:complete len:89 (-) Transcript_4545:21-287(-)
MLEKGNKIEDETGSLDFRSLKQRIHQEPDLAPKIVDLLTEWCNQVDTYIFDNTESESKKENNLRSEELGPKEEIEYWRTRLQRLTSIT